MSEYVFVGHWFIQKYIDDYREALEGAFCTLPEGPTVEYANTDVIAEHILQFGIQPLVEDALFCIFDISNESRPNVALELGYAYGRRKYVVLTSDTQPKEFTNIGGFGILIYNSFKELKNKLASLLPTYVTKARQHNERMKQQSASAGEFMLDERQARQLLELHRAALADKLLPFADDYLRRMKEDANYYNYKRLFRSIRGGIEESRRLLRGFKNPGVGDLKEFVESNFSDFRLARIIRDEIVPVLMSEELDEGRRRAELYRRIREEETKVFDEFYRMLGDESEEDDS